MSLIRQSQFDQLPRYQQAMIIDAIYNATIESKLIRVEVYDDGFLGPIMTATEEEWHDQIDAGIIIGLETPSNLLNHLRPQFRLSYWQQSTHPATSSSPETPT